jgi:hypothetical protein
VLLLKFNLVSVKKRLLNYSVNLFIYAESDTIQQLLRK